MSFEQYFKCNQSKQINKVTIPIKVDQFTELIRLMDRFVSSDIITLDQYKAFMDFSRGVKLVRRSEYEQVRECIQTHPNILVEDRVHFDVLSQKIFTYVFDPIHIKDFVKGSQEQDQEFGSFEFTNEQFNAVQKMLEFISNDKKTFGLYGYAGTGKSTTIIKFVQYLICRAVIKSVAFVAPTNIAVNVLKSKFIDDLDWLIKKKNPNIELNDNINLMELLKEEKYTVDFITVHSLLAYKNEYDVNGNKVWIKLNKNNIDKYNVVIIDECSMLSTQILADLCEEIYKRPHIKIMFLGDPAQLPPVNEPDSWVFASKEETLPSIEYFKKIIQPQNDSSSNQLTFTNLNELVQRRFEKFRDVILSTDHLTLENIARTKCQNIILLSNEIRQFVLNNKVPKLKKYADNKSVFVYTYGRGSSKIKTQLFQKYVEYTKKSVLDPSSNTSNVILAWTNRQVDEYNHTLRQLVYSNRKQIHKFEVGDVLILKDYYKNEEIANNAKFYTSQQIKVLSVERMTKVIGTFVENLMIPLVIKNSADIKEKYVRTVKLINKKTKRKYDIWKIEVIKLDPTNKGDEKTHVLFVSDDSSCETLDNDITLASNEIKKLVNYYKSIYHAQINLVTKKVIKPLWEEFNHKFIDQFARVNCGWSITTHKSQASTFSRVFVDLHDILQNPNVSEAKKCLYTAITRASDEVHLLI